MHLWASSRTARLVLPAARRRMQMLATVRSGVSITCCLSHYTSRQKKVKQRHKKKHTHTHPHVLSDVIQWNQLQMKSKRSTWNTETNSPNTLPPYMSMRKKKNLFFSCARLVFLYFIFYFFVSLPRVFGGFWPGSSVLYLFGRIHRSMDAMPVLRCLVRFL